MNHSKRLLIINEVCGHTSTGKICVQIAEHYRNNGWEVKIAYGRDDKVPEEYRQYAVRIGGDIDVKTHALCTRIFDNHGLCSKKSTKEFLRWADEYQPNTVWLHNLHGYYINYELLFNWLKTRNDLDVKWTLHDCWAFTGHCSHYTYINCKRWMTLCKNCPQKKEYPKSYIFDSSKKNYLRKKAAFTGVKNMTIITPSVWLADQVRQSFLNEYSIIVRHNNIDRNIFKKTENNFREQNHISNETIILAVANVWNEKKGLPDILKLISMLDEEYIFVIVGLNRIQKKKLNALNRTNSIYADSDIDMRFSKRNKVVYENRIVRDVSEMYLAITGQRGLASGTGACRVIAMGKVDTSDLVEIYSSADVFINPTKEDTYPTVNLEARACGLPVITYDVGGCKETITDENRI